MSDTRKDILRGGARVISRKGFREAYIHEIAASADVSHQTVRNHFPGKIQDLLKEILDIAWGIALNALRKQAGKPTSEALVLVFEKMAEFVEADPAMARCMLHEAAGAGPMGTPLVCSHEAEFRDELEKRLRADGTTPAPTRARLLTDLLCTMLRPIALGTTGYAPREAKAAWVAFVQQQTKK